MEDVEIDLLRRIDEAEHRAEDEGAGEGVAKRDAVGEHDAEAADDRVDRQLTAVFGMQRFRQAQQRPCRHDQRADGHGDEDPVPCGEEHDELADAGRDDRDRHEHHEDQRHHLGHATALERVAHDRNGDDARCRGANTLHDTAGEQDGEGWSNGSGGNRRDIDDQAGDQRRAAAETIGDRPEEELTGAEAEDVGGDDVLAVVFILDAERGADLLQGWQHDIDRQ